MQDNQSITSVIEQPEGIILFLENLVADLRGGKVLLKDCSQDYYAENKIEIHLYIQLANLEG